MVSLDEFRLQADELRASRNRVVAAADAARRRIERDLHDGMQQQLVAIAVQLQLARQLMESDDPAALELMDQIRQDVHDALDAVRDLAQTIYPSLLIDRGLADALASAAARAAVPTRVDAAGLGRYSPELESTMYFGCVEALEWVAARAADGVRAAIRAWEDDSCLQFELELLGDDETELPEAALAALRDRLGAVDGEVVSSIHPGSGSCVRGTIPLGRLTRLRPDTGSRPSRACAPQSPNPGPA